MDTDLTATPRQYRCVCGHTTTWHLNGWATCEDEQCRCKRFKFGSVVEAAIARRPETA